MCSKTPLTILPNMLISHSGMSPRRDKAVSEVARGAGGGMEREGLKAPAATHTAPARATNHRATDPVTTSGGPGRPADSDRLEVDTFVGRNVGKMHL